MAVRQDGKVDLGSGKVNAGAAGGDPLVATLSSKPRTREEEVKVFGQLMDAIKARDVEGARKAVLGGAKLDARDEGGRTPLFLVWQEIYHENNDFDEISSLCEGGVVDSVPVVVDPQPGFEQPHRLPKMDTVLDDLRRLYEIKHILEQHGAKE